MQKVLSGTLTSAASTLDAEASDFENFMVQLTGTWSGNIEIQGSLDGTNYRALHVVDATDNGGYGYLQVTTNAIWRPFGFDTILGLQKLRVKFTTYTSGTATVTVVLASSSK